MISFVHTADVHLGLRFNTVSFNRENAVSRREELWSTFQRIVDYTKKNTMDFLFISGDLFEEKYFTLGDINRLRDIFHDAKEINIIISAGNHDYMGEKSLYNRIKWSENVFIFKNKGLNYFEFPKLDTIVYGYSWDSMEIKENQLFDDYDFRTDRKNSILLIHGDIGQGSTYLPLNLDLLNGLNMDYIALGHIHKPQIFSNKMAYPGSPEPLDFGEMGERGFIQGNISFGKTNIEFVPFSKRKFLYRNLSIHEDMGYQDIYNLILDIEGNKDMDYFRIELNGYIEKNIDIDSLILSIKEEFYYIELMNNTTPDYDLDALERDYKDTMIGEYIFQMRAKGIENPLVKKALYYGLDALLKGRANL